MATHRKKEQAELDLQSLVDTVAIWSKKWKLSLNADKCVTCFFSTDSKEANWAPTISIGGQTLEHDPNPILLGVTLDRTLCFSKHVEETTRTASKKLKVLSKISYSDWGADKFQLLRVYQGIVRSRMDYSASAWQPWLSATQMSKLDTVQNRCLRIITGQTRSTPTDALRLEAGTPSYQTISKRLTLISYEKARRLPRGHPRRELLENSVPKRNLRNSWRSTGQDLANQLPSTAHNRAQITLPPRQPWSPKGLYSVHPKIPGLSRKEDLTPDQLRLLAIKCIDSYKPTKVIYTDGSADAGTKEGGSAAIVTSGNADLPVQMDKILLRGAAYTSSFEEELWAAISAVEWCQEYQAPSDHIVVATDSQSLCLLSSISNSSWTFARARSLSSGSLDMPTFQVMNLQMLMPN